MTDKAIASYGYQVISKTIFHTDSSSTECKTLQCIKETKRNKYKKVIREDDTSKGTFASGQGTFFGGSLSK